MSSDPPIPKPRTRYKQDRLSKLSQSSEDRGLTGEDLWPGSQDSCPGGTDQPPAPQLNSSPPQNGYPSLASVTSLISTSIPFLAGVANSIASDASSSAPAAPPPPSAPPPLEPLPDPTALPTPGSGGGSAGATFPPNTSTPASIVPSNGAPWPDTGSFENMLSSWAVPRPGGGVGTAPSAPPTALGEGRAPYPSLAQLGASDGHTDMEALSRLVMATLDRSIGEAAAAPLPPPEAPGDDLKMASLSNWNSKEEETESSSEEEDPATAPASSSADGEKLENPMSDPVPGHTSGTNGISGDVRLTPCRPPPAPPLKKNVKKTPRAATIRVSRKKQPRSTSSNSQGSGSRRNVVSQSSWLDVWKGFRHNVLWATVDGKLMSLWKKRTDKFSEVVFHVSSITNLKTQDKGRFSIYFKKKHYDFMAHSCAVQEAWVTSLQDCRGQASPPPPELDGPITIKEPRNRVYGAVWGHDLWLYNSKDDYQLGVGMFLISMKVASVKPTGKHSFSLFTPYKTFHLSVESSRDLSQWLSCLSSAIRSALSCSQVALRLWESVPNRVCAECGAADPEWASVNLLLVICEACAGQHRALGSRVSKVRSLKLDSKVWTEPLLQLFSSYGNWLANTIWAQAVPADEQLSPDASDEDRAEFIRSKYTRGRYRRLHPLASSESLLNQRLCQVVCGGGVEETMSLICSGAKVLCHMTNPQCPSPLNLAERAGQVLQMELLRQNEYTEVPPALPQPPHSTPGHASTGDEEEALHGKLEEDRFLFSLENDSAACDVLDLREVLSVFLMEGSSHEFELVTLADRLVCTADTQEALLEHFLHILKVVASQWLSEADMADTLAVSRVRVTGGGPGFSAAWAALRVGALTLHPPGTPTQPLMVSLDRQSRLKMDASANTIEVVTGGRTLLLQFEEEHSCSPWATLLQRAANHNRTVLKPAHLTPLASPGTVPPALERCISHITQHGLKVEGIYRRCGLVPKVTRIVEVLTSCPSAAPLDADEQGILDTASALKQYVRQHVVLIPRQSWGLWTRAASLPTEEARLATYRQLLLGLPVDSTAALGALCGHFYLVQIYSSENRMTAHNLALVLVPTLFQELAMNTDLVRLTRELIIYHHLVFLTQDPMEQEVAEAEEQITVF